MDQVRQVVSLVIRRPGAADQILAVQRPSDDPDLPDVWGLPAGRVRPGEDAEEAVRRAGREKLGVKLEPGVRLAQGQTDRPGYRLDMVLFEARIMDGQPAVPQPHAGITQYQAWRWADASLLRPGAALGSLCCRLFFDASPNG